MTEEKILELKREYGTIYKLDIPLGDEEETLILKALDRKTYSVGIKLMEKDELQAGEMFLRSLAVAGDVEAVINDFEALRIAVSLLAEVIGTRTGNVAKL
ncbi:hypothetical protein [uncultured Mediterranean phage uvMED]|nr:hypothetical protein [uncultured Mediterranean phage uvMED]BAR22576.1 hypothetical protein [uncultured Mediterranean phage uvMED]